MGPAQLAKSETKKPEDTFPQALAVQIQEGRFLLGRRRAANRSWRRSHWVRSSTFDATYGSDHDAAYAAYDDAISSASSDAHDDRQRFRKRSGLPGAFAAVATTHWATAVTTSCRSAKFNGAVMGSEFADDADSNTTGDPCSQYWGRDKDGFSGAKEAQQDPLCYEEGGRFALAQFAGLGSRNAEEGRAQQYARDHLCSQRTRRCKGGFVGSRECQSSTAFSVENLLTAVGDQVARIHLAISSLGSCPSGCDPTGQNAGAKISEDSTMLPRPSILATIPIHM